MNTKVITGIVKLAYAHIFEAYTVEGIEGVEPRYSTTVIISKADTETLKAIDAAIGEAKKELRHKGAIITPMRNGDLESHFIYSHIIIHNLNHFFKCSSITFSIMSSSI